MRCADVNRLLLRWIPFGVLFFFVIVGAAQEVARPPRIGLVGVTPGTFAERKLASPSLQAFLVGMRDHGYVEGRDYVIEYRTTEGNPERFADLTAELAKLPVDLFLVPVCGAPLNAARQATKTIPIVVAACNDDLVETRMVESLRRPGGNITGLSKLTPELAAKRLSLLKETLPNISSVAVLWNPGYADFTADWRELKAAAQRMGIRLHSFEFRRRDELEPAFEAMRSERTEALITFSDQLTNIYAGQVAALAAAARLPGMYAFREIPDAGGLMSYGPNINDMFHQSADYVVRILKGAKPADMAIEQPRRIELVINLKTAKALNIVIPPAVLLQADDRIE